jgi:hypothetical protein
VSSEFIHLQKVIVAVLFLFMGSIAFSQETMLGSLERELSALSNIEKLFVVKVSENEITDQLRVIVTDPAIKTDGPGWAMKIGSFCYGTLTLISEKSFPGVASAYRERTELYADVVRGKIKITDIAPLERQIEIRKVDAFDRELKLLQTREASLPDARIKSLSELGTRLGQKISAHAKMAYSKR